MIGAAFTLPITVLLILVISGINYHIQFARAERHGNEYQRSLERLLEHISEHRLIVDRVAAGDEAMGAELIQMQLQIDSDFAALEEVDQRLGAGLETGLEQLSRRKREHYRVSAIRPEWIDLKDQATTRIRPQRLPRKPPVNGTGI